MLNFLTFIMKSERFLNLESPLWFIMYILSSFSLTGFQIQDAEQKSPRFPFSEHLMVLKLQGALANKHMVLF